MSLLLKHVAVPALLVLASASQLAAEPDPVDFQVNLRTGMAFNQPKDHLSGKTLGLGLELGFQTPLGRLSAELGYQYKPGDQYLANVSTYPVAPKAAPADPASSVDSRKNKLEGITFRLALTRPIQGLWSWQAGLQVGGSTFRQEYLADVADKNWNTYEDTYNGVARHTSFPVSPFAGVIFRVNEGSSLQLNVIGLNYKTAEYVHVVGSVADYGGGHTSLDSVSLKNRFVPHLELAYGIRF
ncbi:MAG: hypothetical protein HY014_16275 [Acidobacteria bacterium]|nr:hypothetical protein [Acidobacteriota bacterium]MBI3489687.1 hypothetical protein [Acidobacteriota bacterium]